MSRSEMEADIKAGKYLEHGEYEGNLYGTKIDSILEVVQTGRTCILDVNPQVSCMDSKAVFKIVIPVEFLLGFIFRSWGCLFLLPVGDREPFYASTAS